MTGLQIAGFSDVSVDVERTNALHGRYTAAQALDKLLQGTGLTYRFVNDRTVAIVRRNAPAPVDGGESSAHRNEATKSGLPSGTSAPGRCSTEHESSPVRCEQGAAGPSHRALDEVIVTARKREENLQSVPVAITALSGEVLRHRNVHALEDLRFQVPALQISPSPFGAAVPGISIRGQRQLEAIITLDPAVGVYFADVVWERPHGSNASLYDLESIQVLKGPQGTLFGRNTTGGAVLISPHAPSFDGIGGYGEVAAGNYATRHFEGMLNVPFSSRLAMRIAGKLNEHAGYATNLVDGSEKDDADDQSLRLALAFRPNQDLESNTVYQYFLSRTHGNAWRLGGVNPGGTVANVAAGGGVEVVQDLEDTLALLDTRGWHQVINDQQRRERIETHHASNTTSWDLGAVTLKNIVGWRQIDSFAATDYDGSAVKLRTTAALDDGLPQGPITVFNSQNLLRVHQWTEELQLLGTTFDGLLDWIAGVYYFREAGRDTQRSDLFGRRINDGIAENRSYSVFAQGTHKLPWLQGLSLTAGVRHTWDERRIEQRQKLMLPGDEQFRCRLLAEPVAQGDCERRRTYSDDAPSWGVTLDYKLTADTMAYVARRRGYKSGGLQLRANAPSEPATFNPEFVDDWELGLKSTLEWRGIPLRMNAAIYRQDYDDIQRTLSLQLPGSTQLITTVLNAAKATIRGGELEFVVQPFEPLELSGFINVTRPRYDSFTQISATGTTADLSASEFALIPERVFGTSLKVQLPLREQFGTLALRGQWYRQSDMKMTEINNADGVNTGDGRVSGYAIADLYADWSQVMGRPWNLRLYVRNLSNKDYATGGISVFPTTGIYSYNLGAPRTYGLQLRYRFGIEQ